MSVVEAACLGEYSKGASRKDWGNCSICGWSKLCWECTFVISQATMQTLPEYLVSIYPTVRELAHIRLEELREHEVVKRRLAQR